MTQRTRSHPSTASAALASAALAPSAAALVVGDAARATTTNESTDFGNDFANRTLLPAGTDVVNGNVFPFEGDSADFVTFQGLPAGVSFTLDTTNDGNDVDNIFTIGWYESDSSILGSDFGTGASISGTIPGSGELHFGLSVEGGLGAGVFYTLNLTVPEPSATALLGSGLLAVTALRRVRALRGS